MYLKAFTLESFRNHKKTEIQPGRRINIFFGDNAQGKTNILEAIYILATAKSHRTNDDAEMIAFNGDMFSVKGEVVRGDIPKVLRVSLGRNEGKRVAVNGDKRDQIASLIGEVNVVFFSPEDIEMIKGSPSLRRRFIDIAISQMSPSYLYNLQRYKYIIKQKNRTLKGIGKDNKLKDVLDVYNSQLVDIGSKILSKRLSVLKKLEDVTLPIHRSLTDEKESFVIEYTSNLFKDRDGVPSYDSDSDIVDVRDRLEGKLEEIKGEEIRRGVSLAGPHRDDLVFRIHDMNLRSYGSQGQQRTAAISLKMGEVELIKEDIEDYPIILLDDVFSELDGSRGRAILQLLSGEAQVFLTGVSPNAFSLPQEDISLFSVKSGEVKVVERE